MAQAQLVEHQRNISVDMNEEVNTKFLRNVSRHITHWEGLASQLDLSDAKVHEIKEDYRGNSSEMKYQMLLAWKQKKGREATIGKLIEGLRNVDLGGLADEIEKGQYTEGLR